MTSMLGVAFRLSRQQPHMRHIFFVLCDASPTDSRVVVANFTTGDLGCPTLVISPDEYECLTETSMVAFSELTTLPATDLASGLQMGKDVVRARSAVPEDVVRKIQRAAIESIRTPSSYKNEIKKRTKPTQSAPQKPTTPPPDPRR